MITDLTKASSEQLLSLINEENAANLDFSHIQFQYPTALIDDVDGKDTSVVVNSQPNGGYNGDVIVKYNRLDLNDFTQYGNPELVIPPQGTVEDLVSAFNAFYDASLSLGEDLSTDLSIPADMDYIGKELTLEADESSYAYKGSIVVNVRWETEELSDIIVNGLLSGLEYPYAFKGLIEQLPDRASSSISTTNLASALIEDKIVFFSNATAFNINRVYDPATATYSSPSAGGYPSYSMRAVFDNVVYSASFSTSNMSLSLTSAKTPMTSNAYDAIIITFTELTGVSLSNGSGSAFLAKKGDFIYIALGTTNAPYTFYIASVNVANNEGKILHGPIDGTNGGVDITYSDVFSKSPIIENNLFFIAGARLQKFNLITNELTEIAVLPSGADRSRIVGLGDKIIITNSLSKEIRAYDTEGNYEIIGLLTDYGFSASTTSTYNVTMVSTGDAVYVFDLSNNSTTGRKVIRIS